RAATRRVVLEVDDIPHVEEVVGPTGPAVGSLQPVDAGLSRSVEEHDWIRRANLPGHHHFHVHRPAHRRFLAGSQRADVLAAGVEEPVTGNIIQRDCRDGSRWRGLGYNGLGRYVTADTEDE